MKDNAMVVADLVFLGAVITGYGLAFWLFDHLFFG
jgi:hypothetical protein